MRRMTSIVALGLAVIALGIGCVSTNPYMEKGTPEFASVTEKVIGTWNVTEFLKGNKEVLGPTFESAQLSLDPATGVATFTLTMNKDLIKSKLADWKKNYPDLTVTRYNIVSTATWRVDKKGETIFFEPVDSNIDIAGSGKNFEGFYGYERTKFEMTKTAKENLGGGLAGLLAAKVVGDATAEATGTADYFVQPTWGIGYWIFDLSDSGYVLDTKTGSKFTLRK